MDKTKAQQLVKEITQKFAELSEALEGTLELKGSVTYTDGALTGSWRYLVPDGEKKEFERLAPLYGFTPEDYKRSGMSYSGQMLTLVGFNQSARKYPCVMQGTDGKRYKTDARSAQIMLGRE